MTEESIKVYEKLESTYKTTLKLINKVEDFGLRSFYLEILKDCNNWMENLATYTPIEEAKK